jgi:hypothetical protein
MKTLYGNCLYGLGNRITVVCATYACAQVRGINAAFVWHNEWDCQCEYGDLFEPHPLIQQVSELPKNEEIFSACVYYPDWMGGHLHGARQERLSEEYWSAWRKCARAFKLRPELELPANKGFLVIHARENDHMRAEGQTLHLKDMPAYVACDSASLKAKLLGMMPSSWALETEILDRDYGEGCRTRNQMQDAARDLMMLTRASAILTIGRDSTFRNLAVLGFEVPCFKYYQGLCP